MGVMRGCCWVADSIVPVVSNVFNFIKVGCARAWTEQASTQVSSS